MNSKFVKHLREGKIKVGDRIVFKDVEDAQSGSASSKNKKQGKVVKLKPGNLAVVSFDGSKKNATINLNQASLVEGSRNYYLLQTYDWHGAQIDNFIDKLIRAVPSVEQEDASDEFGREYIYTSNPAISFRKGDDDKVDRFIKKHNRHVEVIKRII